MGVLVAPAELKGSFISPRTLPLSEFIPRTRAVISSSGDNSRDVFSPFGVMEFRGTLGGARSLTMAPRSRRAVESLRRVLECVWRGASLEKSGCCFDERVVCGSNAKRPPGFGLLICLLGDRFERSSGYFIHTPGGECRRERMCSLVKPLSTRDFA